MKTFFESPIGEVIKEALRWAVFGFISILIDQLIKGFGVVEQAPAVLIVTMALRFIDAALHKSEVAKGGLARF